MSGWGFRGLRIDGFKSVMASRFPGVYHNDHWAAASGYPSSMTGFSNMFRRISIIIIIISIIINIIIIIIILMISMFSIISIITIISMNSFTSLETSSPASSSLSPPLPAAMIILLLARVCGILNTRSAIRTLPCWHSWGMNTQLRIISLVAADPMMLCTSMIVTNLGESIRLGVQG